MRLKKLRVLGLATLLVAAGAATAHADGPPETFPLKKVKRGLKGYGLTTMQGTSPERFEFEVVSVTKNFLPKMDIILVKSDDPKLKTPGFWQGMSGSPLYVDGKVMCAFSYGFRFNKVSLGGCTPIEYMKKEGFRNARRIADEATKKGSKTKASNSKRSHKKHSSNQLVPQSVSTIAEWLRIAPDGDPTAALDNLGPTRKPWLLDSLLPKSPARAIPDDDDDKGMTASALPLAMSGFSSPAFKEAKALMAGYALEPMQAGGTGSADEGPTEFSMGSAISVQLLRGDMSAAATGTVSYVDGDSILAFGHPMFQAGEIYAPVATAEIHTVVPSAFSAFIIASPLRELGTLLQDRQSTIAADTSLSTRMVPIHISVEIGSGKNKQTGTFNVELLNNRFFTGTLATIATMNAASYYLPDRDHVTVLMDSKVEIKGKEPLRFTDYLYSSTGAMGAVGASRGLRVLVPLLMNPFSPVEIESVDLSMKIDYATNYRDIERLKLPKEVLEPGKRSYVDVIMTQYDGKRTTQRIPFDVPEKFAGSLVKLEVTAGDSADLDAAPPENLDQLIDVFRQLLPGNVFAVTLYSAEEGVAINGQLIRDMPASALDRLQTSASSKPSSKYHVLSRSTAKSKYVINGEKSILVKIGDRKD